MAEPDTQSRRKQIGAALRRLRERRGINVTAVRWSMGSPTDIVRWEAGTAPLTADGLWRYLQAIDGSFHDLHIELEPGGGNPRLQEIAHQLDSMGQGAGEQT